MQTHMIQDCLGFMLIVIVDMAGGRPEEYHRLCCIVRWLQLKVCNVCTQTGVCEGLLELAQWPDSMLMR